MGWGQRVFGLGVIALGVADLALGEGPGHTALVYAAAAFLIAAGATLQWRRTATWSAAAVVGYFLVVELGLMAAPVVLRHYREFLAWFGAAEALAIAAGALIVFAAGAPLLTTTASRLIRAAQIAFGAC